MQRSEQARESQGKAPIPDWAKGLWDTFQRAMQQGFIAPASSKRHKPHQRIYTKAYADGRQKRGGELYNHKRLITHPVSKWAPPQPSAKARTRAVRRAAEARRGIRQALFGKRG